MRISIVPQCSSSPPSRRLLTPKCRSVGCPPPLGPSTGNLSWSRLPARRCGMPFSPSKRYGWKAAKAANDTAKVNALETWGADSQNIAMQQLAGQAPIDTSSPSPARTQGAQVQNEALRIVESTGPGREIPKCGRDPAATGTAAGNSGDPQDVADLHERIRLGIRAFPSSAVRGSST